MTSWLPWVIEQTACARETQEKSNKTLMWHKWSSYAELSTTIIEGSHTFLRRNRLTKAERFGITEGHHKRDILYLDLSELVQQLP